MSDYISREAAKDVVLENIINRVVDEQGMYGYLCNLVGEVFDSIPAADVQPVKWVNVKDGIPPNERNSYWCYTDCGTMCECRWTNNMYGLGESDSWGWNIMDVPQYQKVTHWMPLPEPPNCGAEMEAGE